MASNKKLVLANAALALVAVFTLALTIYSCANFYTYLPTSDIWVQVDFLAQASQGHLDFQALFEKHNHTHLVVLPRLVYFLDMWLTQGSGILVMLVSLTAVLATAIIFLLVISQLPTISSQEKIFLGLFSIIILVSGCQVESLLNPANLQWSLLTFTATLSAWFSWRFAQHASAVHLLGACTGIVLASLTSATVYLMLLPTLALMASFRWGRPTVLRALFYAASSVAALLLLTEVSRYVFSPAKLPVLVWLASHATGTDISSADRAAIIDLFATHPLRAHLAWFVQWARFNADFLLPPIERLHSGIITLLAAGAVATGLIKLALSRQKAPDHTGVFFGVLLVFVLLTGAATGFVRAYSPGAFTFRFVNVGLLFAAALFPLLYLHAIETKRTTAPIGVLAIMYIVVLTWVSVLEVSAFGYGRNHIRLNQVAYSLDIHDSFVVSALPGTVWEKIDYATVEANKDKLELQGVGIYSDKAWQNVGKRIDALSMLKEVPCHHKIIKMRKLLPEQAAYKIIGMTTTQTQETLSKAYFSDSEGIIRGYAIAVVPSRKTWENWLQAKQWAGFINLDASNNKQQLVMYPYNDQVICRGEAVQLPAYSAGVSQ